MKTHLSELSNNGGQLLLQRPLHPAVAAVAVHLTAAEAEEDWHCGAQRALKAQAESERPKGCVAAANQTTFDPVVVERIVGPGLGARPVGIGRVALCASSSSLTLLRCGTHALALVWEFVGFSLLHLGAVRRLASDVCGYSCEISGWVLVVHGVVLYLTAIAPRLRHSSCRLKFCK